LQPANSGRETSVPFALELEDSLRRREDHLPSEFDRGDALGLILTRYLISVEAGADSFILTSILLLDGTELRHAAAPTLPPAYCAAINGAKIGPCAGSCGTAAHLGRPVYVTDIASDPLWADYRELALPHGLRACWSTPIFGDQQEVLGTFAIYHLATGAPTAEEIVAISMITDHVSRAILWSKSADKLSHQQAAASSTETPT
jgi:GAF domain-containing protein